MATTYYWVGGSGTWSSSGNTHFATGSGGTAGTATPGVDDTVIIDSNSFITTAGSPGTITINGSVNVGYITVDSSITGTFYHNFEGINSAVLNIYGSLSVNGKYTIGIGVISTFDIKFWGGAAGLIGSTGVLNLNNTNNSTYPTVSLNSCGVYISVSYSSTTPFSILGRTTVGVNSNTPLTCGTFQVSKGYINYYVSSISCVTFDQKTLSGISVAHNFSSTTAQQINISGSLGFINTGSSGLNTLIWSGGLSVINIQDPNASFYPIPSISNTATGVRTYPTVNFTSTSFGTRNIRMNSAVAITNLNVYAPSTSGTVTLLFASQTSPTNTSLPTYTISNLNSTGMSKANRVFLRTTTIGANINLAVTTVGLQSFDLMNITKTGTALSLNDYTTGAGDCGGNVNISFPLPRTLYWCLSGLGPSDFSAGWADNSSGSGSGQILRAQDTGYIVGYSAYGGAAEININSLWNIGSLNTYVTRALSGTGAASIIINLNADINVYKGLNFPNGYYNAPGGLTINGTGNVTMPLAAGADATLDLSAFAAAYFPRSINVSAYPYAALSLSVTCYAGNNLALSNDAYLKMNNYALYLNSSATIDVSAFTGLSGSYAVDGGGSGVLYLSQGTNFAGTTLAKVTRTTLNCRGNNTITNFYSDSNDSSITLGTTTAGDVTTFLGINRANQLGVTTSQNRTMTLSSAPTDYLWVNGISIFIVSTGKTFTINSDSPGAQGTIKMDSSITVTRCSITDNKIMSPTASVYTYTATSSMDGGNNTGWVFGTTPVVTVGGKFFLVF